MIWESTTDFQNCVHLLKEITLSIGVKISYLHITINLYPLKNSVVGKALAQDYIAAKIAGEGKGGPQKPSKLYYRIKKDTKWLEYGYYITVQKRICQRMLELQGDWITQTSIPWKIFTWIIENRMRERLEDSTGETQHGFRNGGTTQDLTFTMRQLWENCWVKAKKYTYVLWTYKKPLIK